MGPAQAGAPLRYVVVISNPTGADIALDPCPGNVEERFSMGTATVRAANESSLQRLNCRTRSAAAPGGGSLRFEIKTAVPGDLSAGRQLSVAWRFVALGLVLSVDAHQGGFSVTAR